MVNFTVAFRVTEMAAAPLKKIAAATTLMSDAASRLSVQARAANAAIVSMTTAFDAVAVTMSVSAANVEEALARLETATETSTRSVESALGNAERQARDFSTKYSASIEEIIRAQFRLATAGVPVAEQVDAVQGAFKFATATAGNFTDAAELLGSFLNTFGKSAQMNYLEPADKVAKITDVMSTAVQKFQLDMNNLNDSLKFLVGPAGTLGLSVEETVAFAGAMNTAGFRGTLAGTAISNAFNKIDNAIEKLDLDKASFTDASGNLKDFASFLDEIERATAGMTSIQKQSKYIEVFDIRAGRAIGTLIDMKDNVRKLAVEMSISKGATEEMAAMMEKTTIAKFTKFKNSLDNISSTVGKGLNESLRPMLDLLTGAAVGIDKFIQSNQTLFKTLITTGAVVLTVSSAVLAFATIGPYVGNALTDIASNSKKAAIAVGVLRTSWMLLTRVMVGLAMFAGIELIIQGVKLIRDAINSTESAWAKLALGIAGVALVAGGLFTTFYSIITVMGAMLGIWKTIKATASSIGASITGAYNKMAAPIPQPPPPPPQPKQTPVRGARGRFQPSPIPLPIDWTQFNVQPRGAGGRFMPKQPLTPPVIVAPPPQGFDRITQTFKNAYAGMKKYTLLMAGLKATLTAALVFPGIVFGVDMLTAAFDENLNVAERFAYGISGIAIVATSAAGAFSALKSVVDLTRTAISTKMPRALEKYSSMAFGPSVDQIRRYREAAAKAFSEPIQRSMRLGDWERAAYYDDDYRYRVPKGQRGAGQMMPNPFTKPTYEERGVRRPQQDPITKKFVPAQMSGFEKFDSWLGGISQKFENAQIRSKAFANSIAVLKISFVGLFSAVSAVYLIDNLNDIFNSNLSIMERMQAAIFGVVNALVIWQGIVYAFESLMKLKTLATARNTAATQLNTMANIANAESAGVAAAANAGWIARLGALWSGLSRLGKIGVILAAIATVIWGISEAWDALTAKEPVKFDLSAARKQLNDTTITTGRYAAELERLSRIMKYDLNPSLRKDQAFGDLPMAAAATAAYRSRSQDFQSIQQGDDLVRRSAGSLAIEQELKKLGDTPLDQLKGVMASFAEGAGYAKLQVIDLTVNLDKLLTQANRDYAKSNVLEQATEIAKVFSEAASLTSISFANGSQQVAEAIQNYFSALGQLQLPNLPEALQKEQLETAFQAFKTNAEQIRYSSSPALKQLAETFIVLQGAVKDFSAESDEFKQFMGLIDASANVQPNFGVTLTPATGIGAVTAPQKSLFAEAPSALNKAAQDDKKRADIVNANILGVTKAFNESSNTFGQAMSNIDAMFKRAGAGGISYSEAISKSRIEMEAAQQAASVYAQSLTLAESVLKLATAEGLNNTQAFKDLKIIINDSAKALADFNDQQGGKFKLIDENLFKQTLKEFTGVQAKGLNDLRNELAEAVGGGITDAITGKISFGDIGKVVSKALRDQLLNSITVDMGAALMDQFTEPLSRMKTAMKVMLADLSKEGKLVDALRTGEIVNYINAVKNADKDLAAAIGALDFQDSVDDITKAFKEISIDVKVKKITASNIDASYFRQFQDVIGNLGVLDKSNAQQYIDQLTPMLQQSHAMGASGAAGPMEDLLKRAYEVQMGLDPSQKLASAGEFVANAVNSSVGALATATEQFGQSTNKYIVSAANALEEANRLVTVAAEARVASVDPNNPEASKLTNLANILQSNTSVEDKLNRVVEIMSGLDPNRAGVALQKTEDAAKSLYTIIDNSAAKIARPMNDIAASAEIAAAGMAQLSESLSSLNSGGGTAGNKNSEISINLQSEPFNLNLNVTGTASTLGLSESDVENIANKAVDRLRREREGEYIELSRQIRDELRRSRR